MLPKITDYLDSLTGAVQRFGDCLQISKHPDDDLKAIREAVSQHVKLLSLKWLLTYSYVIADDLYKQGNTISVFSNQHRYYLEATAGVFFKRFHDEGFVLRYGINNSFEETDLGMQRPLYLFQGLFEAAGLVYICPAAISLIMMKDDGIPNSEFLKNYRRYEAGSRDIAILSLKKCEELRKSYVALELEGRADFLRESWSNSDRSAVTMFREEAPNPGSKIMVDLPKTPGLA